MASRRMWGEGGEPIRFPYPGFPWSNMRRFAIGDIHGCGKALRTLVTEISPDADDQLVFLGDYVDRGPDSRDVVDQILELQTRAEVIPLRGNHEIMLLGVAAGTCDPDLWLRSGGQATLASYGGSIDRIPAEHIAFLESTLRLHESESEIFVHAMYREDLEMQKQAEETLFWEHLPDPLPGPHFSGKRVVLGHTPQPGGEILLTPHLVCLDTYCFGGGYLSAMNLDDQSVIQVNRQGHVRRVPIAFLWAALVRLRAKFLTGRRAN
ncbi:MAG: metallophosphoesterase family protein [Planctomycetota bacterium]